MPSKTTNYGLIKPNKDEFYDVQVQNGNMDIIDQQLKINADNLASTNRTLTERIIEVENQLSSEPPVQSSLNRGEQILTTGHDSTARVITFEGDTIINYVPLFNSGLLLSKNANSIIEEPSKFRAISPNAFGYCGGFKIPLKPNTTYTLIMDIEAIKGNDYFFIRSNEDDINLLSGSYQGYDSDGVQFTTKADTAYIHLIFSVNANDSEIVYSNVRIVEGTTAQPFVADIKGIVNPTIDNTTTGNSITLLGTFHKGDVVSMDKGQYSVFRTKKEILLDDKFSYNHYLNNNGFKTISIPFTNRNAIEHKQTSMRIVKYNGTLLINNGNDVIDKDNMFSFRHWETNKPICVTIANTDSGWGDSYTPTPDEIKAYFLGWVMDTAGQAYPSPYNGTGTKEWIKRRADGGIDSASATTIVPKTKNELIPSYRLIYDLAIPVKEPVQTINNVLKLEKGENVLEVSEGRVVREKFETTLVGSRYYVNWKSYPQSMLKHEVNSIIKIYKNGNDDTANWVLSSFEAHGNYRFSIDENLYDQKAVYTVDYEPLYLFEVTAPTNLITIEYQSNIASVINQNIGEIVDISKRTSVIENSLGNVAFLDKIEGSWTPTITGATEAIYHNQKGRFWKIGRLVFVEAVVTLTSLPTIPTGSYISIGGLPYIEAGGGDGGGLSVGFFGNLTSTNISTITARPNSRNIILYGKVSNTSGMAFLPPSELTAKTDFRISGTYLTTTL